MASEQESWNKMKQWEAMSNVEIRAMLVRVEGKHRELCVEAQHRIMELDKSLKLATSLIQELSLPPHPDSDPASLLETLRVRAKDVLKGLEK